MLNATGITAALTTSTPYVTILQSESTYPNLSALGGSGTNTAPFLFSIASDAPCPLAINFTLTVSYTGGASASQSIYLHDSGAAADHYFFNGRHRRPDARSEFPPPLAQ